MSRIRPSVPSPALVISLIALFVAMGGSGYAATQVSFGHAAAKKKKKPTHADSAADKKLIKSLAPTLSVASAKKATTATSATNAANATNATNATNAQNAVNAQNAANASNAANATNAGTANNANNLGGQPASAYATTNHLIITGLVKVSGSAAGNKVTVLTHGPFTVTLTCTKDASGNVKVSLDATSSEDNSVIDGSVATPAGTSENLTSIPGAADKLFHESNNVNYDFQAPSGAEMIVVGATGTNSLGTDCWTNLSGVV